VQAGFGAISANFPPGFVTPAVRGRSDDRQATHREIPMSIRTNIWRVAAVALVWTVFTAASRADVVMDWNAQSDAIATARKLASPVHSRANTLLHVAMFEAVNAIERRYQPYRLNLVADRRTSPEAAAAVAGHTVLLALYPEDKASLDKTLAQMLDAVPDGNARERGMILGRKAATDLLALRVDDGGERVESWRPLTQPGLYVPTAAVASSTVGQYLPWVMSSAAQFRPEPPPSLTSETWTRDVNEIRAVGALDSKTRTADQTAAAKVWLLTGARTWDPVVQQVAVHRKMDLVDCARLYALAQMAGMDAYIAVFEAKYTYNFWRPVTAIRNADITGNAATPRDAGWLPLAETPMHPEYPCAHCITSAAVAAVLRAVAKDDVGELSVTSPTAPGVTRRWTRLDDYANEVSNARIWAGFHYRFSTVVGQDMGRKIGELTVATRLRPRT
jgi:hypothetical protein